MKPLKFKAWDKRFNQWAYGTHPFVLNEENQHHLNLSAFFARIRDGRLDESTLCQFIGLEDQDGKEIFEGDIYQTEFLRSHPTNRHGGSYWVKVLCVVELDKGRYVGRAIKYIPSNCEPDFSDSGLVGSIGSLDNKIKILGSIHQNPEQITPP